LPLAAAKVDFLGEVWCIIYSALESLEDASRKALPFVKRGGAFE